MLKNTRHFACSAALAAGMALGSSAAFAADIRFTEHADGSTPVDVARDNFDWLTFSSSSTAETAHADATLFKFDFQGSTPGTYGYFLTEAGVRSDVLVATVTNIDQNNYSVVYDFYSDPEAPALAGTTFTQTFTAEELPGGNSFFLPSYSHSIFIDSGTVEMPEPATFALLGLGLIGAGVARRRK